MRRQSTLKKESRVDAVRRMRTIGLYFSIAARSASADSSSCASSKLEGPGAAMGASEMVRARDESERRSSL